MRAKHCAVCGSPLPEGGRIDRRYCREACRVMAYRQRHPKEARNEVAPAPPRDTAGANQNDSPSSLPEERPHVPNDLAAASERIADLELQFRALRQRATSIELQHERIERRLAIAEVAIRRLLMARKEMDAPAIDEPASSAQGEDKPRAADMRSAATMMPWMMASSDDLLGQVPKWTLLQEDFITMLDEKVERVLAHLPELLALLGRANMAVQVRQWQRSEIRTFRRLARAMARRIVSTELAQRKTESQMRELAKQLLADLANPHPSEDIGDRAAWAQLLVDGQDALTFVASFLILQLQSSDWIGVKQQQ